MRIVHIADPHLGYRAYNRVNPAGLNAREADVFHAFRQALAKTIEVDPDVIVVAGDLFHVVRPSNLMIQYAFREFAQLRLKTDAPIVIVGGNHDSPRSADTGCILDLFRNIEGVYVAHSEYVQVRLQNLNMSVFCLCHRALPHLSTLKIEPDPESRYNVLVGHGTVEGVLRHAYDLFEITRSQVISDAWDYIAFGHYHVFEELAQNAYYAGSLEFTSTNIWSELAKPKGLIEYDLDERKLVAFHEVETREVVDLRPIDAAGVSADDLNLMLRHRIEGIAGGHANKIVRLVVENLPRSVQADLDWSAVRQIRAEALHFELQLRPARRDSRTITGGDSSTARSLEEEWDEFAGANELPAGVEREAFKTLGRDYLAAQASVEQS